MYEEMTPERLKEEIKAGLRLEADRREGSFADDMAGPAAVELSKLYGSLNAVEPIVWVNEGSGPYLDLAAEDLGLEPRKAGTRAAATLTVTGAEGFTVRAGTRFATADGLLFAAAGDAVIEASGTVEIEALAERAGSAYNVAAGEIRLQYQNDSRIKSVANAESAQGGTDPESDAGLYARIDHSRKRPRTSGNVHDYEAWALEADGVGYAKCTPLQYGPGTVGVLIAGPGLRPVDGTVAAACAAHIEELRPVGAEVTVKPAGALAIDVAAAVALEGGAAVESVRTAFAQALEEYLRSLAFREYVVRLNRVGALLMGVEGVADFTGLRLNGAAESVAVGPDQVPVLGEVAFT